MVSYCLNNGIIHVFTCSVFQQMSFCFMPASVLDAYVAENRANKKLGTCEA